MTLHDDHLGLRAALHALAGTGSVGHHDSGAYTGSPHRSLSVAVPELRRLARRWLGEKRALLPGEILTILDRMFASDLYDEKTLAALILGYSKTARPAATPDRVDAWLDHLAGWAEIDSLCSNVFQAEDFFADWAAAYGPWLRGLATDPNINKRRASLVLLTGPVRRSDDSRLIEASLHNLGKLQVERAPLITKAVSWLLRNLSARHRDVVIDYLEEHRAALPAIALREVSAKLETGRKTRTQH
jgi:3-methyladenine DNA glycosylase AlkD